MSDTAENGSGEVTETLPDLQELLGVTPEGNCTRHPNCPVLSLAHNKVMSCRVCYAEEKSVGIRQRKSYAAVIHQLQQISESEENGGSNGATGEETEEDRRRRVKLAHAASMQALILQQPQTMDSIMKRMTQVQNWMLRQKEKEVMSLKLQTQSLEEKLHEAETKNQEQRQTIWALRRTIQQDMKIIKTMAVQKERERDNLSQHGSPMNSSTSSPSKRSGYFSAVDSPSLAASPDKTRSRSGSAHTASSTPLASPAGKIFLSSGHNTPDLDGTPNHDGNKTPEAMKGIVLDNDTDPLLDKVRQKKKALQSKFEELRAAHANPAKQQQQQQSQQQQSQQQQQPVQQQQQQQQQLPQLQPPQQPQQQQQQQWPQKSASAHVSGRPVIQPGGGGLKRTDAQSFRAHSTRSLDKMVEPPPDQKHSDIVLEPQEVRTQYWNDEEYANLTADPSKIFASFRGGLLDIPKSPPAASHDNRQKNRPKLQLDTDQMAQLKMPRMRGVGRTLSYQSDDGLSVDGLSIDGQSIQSMGSMSDAQREIPLHKLAATLETLPFSRPLGDETPEQMFEKGKGDYDVADDRSTSSYSSYEQPPPPPLSTAAPQPIPIQSGRKTKRTVSTDEILDVVPEAHNEDEDINTSKTNIMAGQSTAPVPAPPITSSSGDSGGDSGQSGQSKNSRPSIVRSNPSVQDDETVDTTPTFFTEAGASAVLSGQREQQQEKEKFLFPVTSAQCQDKYGDGGMYSGTILVTEGLPHGNGCMNYESGRVYNGDWVSGQWHGHGKLLNPNGDTYEGEFVLDARHGKGEYRWDNGDVYTGDFSYDRRNGNGKFCFHNGNVYEGEFVDGMFEGFGRYDFGDGYYEGEWRAGRYHGDGELQYANGGKYTGEFRESLAHGFGVEMLPDGQKRRGVWERGQPVEFFHRSAEVDASSRGG